MNNKFDLADFEVDIDRALEDFYKLPTIGKADDIFAMLEQYLNRFHYYKDES